VIRFAISKASFFSITVQEHLSNFADKSRICQQLFIKFLDGWDVNKSVDCGLDSDSDSDPEIFTELQPLREEQLRQFYRISCLAICQWI